MGSAQGRRASATEADGRNTHKYEQIRNDLATAIRQGQYRPGEALPSQRELSAAYGVTLMTLRQALRVLSDEGLVVQQPGRGTFVAPPQLTYQRKTLRSLSEELRGQGIDVETKVLAISRRRPPAAVAAALGTSDGQRVMRVERLRTIGGKPAVHQVSWVPEALADGIRHVDLAEVPLYAALAEIDGLVIIRGSETIRPALLTGAAARHLTAPPGSPVFVSERITFGLDDRPMVFDRAVVTGDLMVIRTERVSSTMAWSWGLS